MIAQKGSGGELIVLGTGQRESRGVRRGCIADMAATEVAVREAVEQAERIAQTNIENVWVGFSAGGLVSDVASIEFEMGGHRIEQADIDACSRPAVIDRSPPHGCTPARAATLTLTGVKKPSGCMRPPRRAHPCRRRRWFAGAHPACAWPMRIPR